uniref:Tim44-like domain-containing protein n=1 Tax=Photinus pyralis TaxID=7054 RepID=A0A1Y1N834_PHOPY
MVVLFGQTLKLYNPYVTLRKICQLFTLRLHPHAYHNGVRYLRSNSEKTPDLVYIPQVFRWLRTKAKFKYLQKTWDPEFSEGAFIFGSIQAICKISEIIHTEDLERLNGLLTETARLKLVSVLNDKLTAVQKKVIKISPVDIKIMVPTEVNLKRDGERKTCEICLRSLSLKWFEGKESTKLVLIALQTDFLRDYGQNVTPEWTVNVFDILECAVLNESRFPK